MVKYLSQWLLLTTVLIGLSGATIIPRSPCPKIFQYERESLLPLPGSVVGLLVLDGIRGNYNNTVQVSLSMPAVLSSSYGSIHLRNLDELPQKPARFEVHFPTTINIPSVASITFNGEVVCKGNNNPYGPWTSTITLSYYVIVPARKQAGFPNRVDSYEDIKTTKRPIKPIDHHHWSEHGSYYHHHHHHHHQEEMIHDRTTTQRPAKSIAFNEISPLNNGACGKPVTPSIPLLMGGTKTRRSDWPWLSVIFYKNRDLGSVEFRCGASLISDRILLTAAHCLLKSDGKVQLQPGDVLISLGRYNILEWGEPTAKTVSPRDLILHPQYSGETLDYDIAIVTLAEPVSYTATIRSVCLWHESAEESLIVGQSGTVVGWGFSTVGALSEVPKQVQLRIVSEVDCIRSDIGLQLTTSERTICAGGEGTGPCQGDSGSGLYLLRSGRWLLRGIVSHSLLDPETGKCDMRKYSVYTDVAEYQDWLREHGVG